MSLFLALLLQLAPQLPNPDANVNVGGEILGPYIFREDQGQTTKVILKNGLTVIVRENNAVPLTSVTTHVKVGYFDEPDRVSGIAHVIEHMFFKGTERRGVGQIAKETKALGGSLNAYTSYDRTVYHTVVPADNAAGAMAIQADALLNPVFDAEELAREIEVVLQENDRKLDNPPAVVQEQLYATAFARHRMRRWRIGTAEGLRRLSRDDVVDFYSKYYQPSNVILAVVGQFEREEMLAQIVGIYGDAPDTPVQREPGPIEPPQTGLRYDWQRGPIEQPQVAIGYHVPGIDGDDSDVFALEVLSAVLTGGRAARLNWYLRDEQGLINSAAASYLAYGDLGYFMLRLETTDPGAAQIGAFGELDRIRRFGITEEELARARVQIAQAYYHRVETVGGIADEVALQEAYGDWKRMNFFLEGVQAVSGDDILRVASEYLTRDNLSVFEYLPESMPRALSSAEFEASVLDQVPLNIVERSIDELEVSAQVQLLDDELVMDVTQPLVRRSIRGGLDVTIDAYIAEDHRLPLVSFGIFFPGGRRYETAENAGITDLMLRTALRGTRRLNTADISRRLENAGARIEVVNEADFYGYVLDGVSGQIDTALDILMEVLQEPTFLDPVVEQEKAFQQARIRRLHEDNLRQPIQMFMSTLFDDHSYARPRTGSEESVMALTSNDLIEWHRDQQRTVVPLIVMAGDIRGTGLLASIAETLTNEDLSQRNIENLAFPDAPLNQEEDVHTSGRRQSALVYGTMVGPYTDEDRFPLTVIGNVLSGLGGRLFETIREEQGLAYTVRIYKSFMAKAGAFFAYTAFSPENEAAVRESLQSEFDRLIADGITDEELEKAVNYSIGVHEMGRQTRRGRVLELAHALVAGVEASTVDAYPILIRQVDRALVQATAEKYLSSTQAKTVVFRGER
jgi:zinc protease